MKKYIVYLVWICLFGLVCTSESTRDSILARVAGEPVTRQELEESFILNPQYAIRTSLWKAKRSQLEYLVEQKYYYLAARAVKLADDPVIRSRIEYIKNQEIIKAHIHQKFLNDIVIDDQKRLESLRCLNTKIRVQHLFAHNLEEAKVLERRLSQGESFESLAREIYSDSSLSETGGDLGYIGFGDMDPQLEDRVYKMKLGEISEPVQSVYGYHILKVSDVVQDEQQSEMTLSMKMSLINDILRNRQADKAIREYLNELAGNKKIQVNNRVLDLLVNATQQVMGDRYSQADPFKPPIRSGDLHQIELDVEDVLDEVLVRFSDQEIRVVDFLNRLRQMPPLHRPYLKTRNRMSQAIIDMIRNDLLLADAKESGVHESKEVNAATEKIIKEFLAEEFRKRFYSENFKSNLPEEWETYAKQLKQLKDKISPIYYEEQIYADLGQTDSLMAPEPIPVFLKSRYMW